MGRKNKSKRKEKRKTKSKKSFSGLQIPDDILLEIFKRLPAKSLMRFMSVSKRWQTLIRDRYFAESHHLHAQTRSDASCILFCVFDHQKYGGLTTILASDNEGKFSSQLPKHSFIGYYPCTNIVNGLMCFIDLERHMLNLLNLTTREKLYFPCPREKEKHIFGHSPNIPLGWYLLGFDPMTKQYKLLYFVFERHDFVCGPVKDCYILTLGRSSSWRKIDCPKGADWNPICGRIICVSGTIYWIDVAYRRAKSKIQYFDVREEKFHIVPDPKIVKRNHKEHRLGRNLAIACVVKRDDLEYASQVFDLWALDYGQKFWVNDQVQFPEHLPLITTVHVIGSNKNDEILLMAKPRFGHFKYLMINYNLQTRTFRTNKITWPHDARISVDKMRVASTFGEFTVNLMRKWNLNFRPEVDYSQILATSISNHVENILPLRFLFKEDEKVLE